MVTDQEIVKKIYFPRILLPASTIFVALIDFAIASVILVALMVWYQFIPDVMALFIVPVGIIITYVSSLGLGLFLSALNINIGYSVCDSLCHSDDAISYASYLPFFNCG